MHDEERVALDAGIYVAGLIRNLPPERHLGATILHLARKRAFRLVVLNSVVNELIGIADREGLLPTFEREFLDLLSECDVEWVTRKNRDEAEYRRSILRRLRHVNDLPVALEVVSANPDFFIHSNPDHWTSALDSLLGTSVMTPREYLLAHGIRPADPIKH